MSDGELELPAFVRELDATASGDALSVAYLHELLTGNHALARTRSRLLTDVESLPLRYAPFFDRLMDVWDLPEANVLELLERAKDPSLFRKTPLPGLRVLEVQGGPRVRGADVHLVRFSSGMRFPRHRHPGDEILLVLEGSYTDSSGRKLSPGDIHAMSAGTEHDFRVSKDGPCVAASVQRGREFTGFWIRLLSKLVP
jgi:quercetin dioxygenase-like cupin family protein